jgi:magnesium-transporting ATPase (P-type)
LSSIIFVSADPHTPRLSLRFIPQIEAQGLDYLAQKAPLESLDKHRLKNKNEVYTFSQKFLGSDVAKQAADIVLIDDNFSSMVKAVEEGRLMFDNIKKLMIYVLTHSFPELWALFVYYLFGMPIGITTLQILSIDLGTEIFPGIALCKEPLEGDVMKRPPRKTGKTLIGKTLLAYVYGYAAHIQAVGCFLAYLSVYW